MGPAPPQWGQKRWAEWFLGFLEGLGEKGGLAGGFLGWF